MADYRNGVPWADQAGGPALGPGSSWEVARPARAADVGSDVTVPLFQAGITGALLAGVLVFAVWLLMPDAGLLALFKAWAMLALLFGSVAWVLLVADHHRLLWFVEKVFGADLDDDGVRGAPEPKERVVIVNGGRAAEEATNTARELANRERRSQFAAFVAGIPVVGTSERAWLARGMPLLQYKEYRDLLIRCRYASWKSTRRDGTPHERLGWSLSVPYQWVLDRVTDD